MEKLHHGKSKGKVFTAFFRNLGGVKFINCSINFVSQLYSAFVLAVANIKMFNMQKK